MAAKMLDCKKTE